MSQYSETAAFWLFNRVANFCYLRYDSMIVDVQRVQRELEDGFVREEQLLSIASYGSTLTKTLPASRVTVPTA